MRWLKHTFSVLKKFDFSNYNIISVPASVTVNTLLENI